MSRLKWVLPVLLAAIGGSAAAAAPASATLKLTWWECKKVTGGLYQEASCSVFGPPDEYEWEQAPFGFLLFLTTRMTWTVKGTVAGVKITMECKKGNGEGWLENPAAKTPGIDFSENKLTECSVSGAGVTGCKVSGSPTFKADTELAEVEGKAVDIFKEHGGAALTSFTLESCTQSGLDSTYPIGGRFYGIVNNSTSSLEFASKTGELKLAGSNAATTGTYKIETTGGDSVKVE